MSEHDDFGEVKVRLQAAMSAVLNGDTSLMKALHSHADDVTSFYGMGGYEQGWGAVAKRWDWAAATLFSGGTVRYDNLSSGVSGNLGYTVDIENHAQDDGTISRRLRVTHIFRREDGEWRLVHRHGNPLQPQTGGS